MAPIAAAINASEIGSLR